MDLKIDRLGFRLSGPIWRGEGEVCILSPLCIQEMSRRTQTVWIRSEWAFVFQTHCKRHRAPLVESCAVCFVEDPLLPITNLPASTRSLSLPSCLNLCSYPPTHHLPLTPP